MSQYLFLYGTLLPGHAPPDLREVTDRLKRTSAGSMPGQLYDLGHYPGAVFDPSGPQRVLGHVFEWPHDPHLLSRLDEYEGYSPNDPESSLFVRQERPITLLDGSVQMCWVYLYNRPTGQARRIPVGDYALWQQDHRATTLPPTSG